MEVLSPGDGPARVVRLEEERVEVGRRGVLEVRGSVHRHAVRRPDEGPGVRLLPEFHRDPALLSVPLQRDGVAPDPGHDRLKERGPVGRVPTGEDVHARMEVDGRVVDASDVLGHDRDLARRGLRVHGYHSHISGL